MTQVLVEVIISPKHYFFENSFDALENSKIQIELKVQVSL
jgi:hypothetical protein